MALAKVYIETTIPSYLGARPSLHTLVFTHQQLTELWWERRRHAFQLFVSELVLAECSAGDPDLAARRRLVSAAGYELPVICTPEELMGGETIDV